jgi:hypothetical protein
MPAMKLTPVTINSVSSKPEDSQNTGTICIVGKSPTGKRRDVELVDMSPQMLVHLACQVAKVLQEHKRQTLVNLDIVTEQAHPDKQVRNNLYPYGQGK